MDVWKNFIFGSVLCNGVSDLFYQICAVRVPCKCDFFRLINDVNISEKSFVCTISLALGCCVCGRFHNGMCALSRHLKFPVSTLSTSIRLDFVTENASPLFKSLIFFFSRNLTRIHLKRISSNAERSTEKATQSQWCVIDSYLICYCLEKQCMKEKTKKNRERCARWCCLRGQLYKRQERVKTNKNKEGEERPLRKCLW